MKRLVLAAFLATALARALAVDVTFLAWDQAVAERELAVASGSNLQDIEQLHPLKRSVVVKASTNDAGEILVRAKDRTTDDGKPAEFAVKIPAGIQRPMILLAPDPKSPAELRGLAFDDSTSRFPWGGYRILNLTGADLLMGLGRHKHALPGEIKPVDVPNPGDKPVPVVIALAKQPDPVLYSNLWQPEPDARRIVILVPGNDPRLGKLAVKVVSETRADQAAATD